MSESPTLDQREWRGQPKRVRPRIRPPRSRAEIICLLVTILGLLGLLAITAYWWPALPATIPTHFGVDGKPDAYGSKNTLLLLPGLLLALTLLFAFLARYPWIYNYPVLITPENAARQYRRGRTVLASVNAVLAVAFALIQWQIIEVTRGANTMTINANLALLIAFSLLIPFAVLALLIWWIARGR